jgi:uncharacterized protein YdhG (YjbR/CyaY superfamily)
MAAGATVDEYIAGFPPEVAERLQRIREVILAEVPSPEEKVRYGIAAVMLGGRYALHYAGWKKHIGLYPVPTLDEPLENAIAPYRAEKDSVVFPHRAPVPYELVGEVTKAIVARRAAQSPGD